MADLAHVAETAMNAVLSGTPITGVAYMTGHDDATATVPCVISACDVGEEHVKDTGIHLLRFTITIRSKGDSLTNHATYCDAVDDLLRTDSLPASLSSGASEFYCYGIWPVASNRTQSDDHLVTTIELEAHGCASDLTA